MGLQGDRIQVFPVRRAAYREWDTLRGQRSSLFRAGQLGPFCPTKDFVNFTCRLRRGCRMRTRSSWAKRSSSCTPDCNIGQEFDCATWLHKARSLPKEEFKREVEKELTGRESEPWEIIYFKLYKTQIPVVEQAIETAALMLGTDKSRGYCLEMICADFLAGANLENDDPTVLLQSMSRFFKFLPGDQRQAFLHEVTEKAS